MCARHSLLVLLMVAAPVAAASARSPAAVQPWTPAGVSSGLFESHAAFDPVNGDLYFVRSSKSFSGWRILTSHCDGKAWTPPVPPSFAGAGLEAMGEPPDSLEVQLVQFVSLYRKGEKVPMSTRAGEFITLRQLRAEVGNDACRFFYVMRSHDQHLDFDLELAKSRSNENPVYYVQYAHARISSILGDWQGKFGGNLAALPKVDLAPLSSERALALIAKLGEFPDMLTHAASELAPHAVAFYLRELAAEFHSFYNAERVLVDDAAERDARVALLAATRQVLANGLAVIGVSAPERM